MASRPPSLTLFALTPSPSSHPSLPLLDPSSLYLATLLLTQCPTTSFCVRPPNLLLHKSLPRLEVSGSGVVLAEGVKGMERWVMARRSPSASGEKEGAEGAAEEEDVQQAALSAYLERHIEPLVYSILFPSSTGGSSSGGAASSSSVSSATSSPYEPIFSHLTFPGWASHLPFPASRSLPHSVRKGIEQSLPKEWRRRRSSAPKKGAGLTGQEMGKGREEGPERVQLGKPSRSAFWGFGRREREGWSDEFERKRLTGLARRILAPVVSWLASHPSPTTSLPSPVEVQLFSLLAPILLCTAPRALEALRSHPVAHLLLELEEYAQLREWMRSRNEEWWSLCAPREGETWVGRRLGGGQEGEALPTVTREEDSVPAAAAPSSSTTAPTAPSSSSSKRSWSSYIPFFGGRSSDASSTKGPAANPEPTSLRIGRYIWIGTALLGTVGWLFASGVVSIDFSGEEEEVEEVVELDEEEMEKLQKELEDVEGEEEEEKEDEEGWRFARGGGEDDDDDDDDDEDIILDLDDDDDYDD